jgi:competence protein ComFB
MNLVNYMEEAACAILGELLQDPACASLRGNEKAKLDILAYALNRLPPRYFVTEKGQLFTRIQELRQQFKTDILVELTKGIQQVLNNPR